MERCIGIQWGPGPLPGSDGPPAFGIEFQPGEEIVTEERDGLILHYKHVDSLTQIVLRRYAQACPVISFVIPREDITVEPFLVWEPPDNGEPSR
jgi:hypothetical protein